MIELAWSPKEESSQRQMVLFKVEGTVRLQAFLIGKAEVPAKPKKVTFKLLLLRAFQLLIMRRICTQSLLLFLYLLYKESRKLRDSRTWILILYILLVIILSIKMIDHLISKVISRNVNYIWNNNRRNLIFK